MSSFKHVEKRVGALRDTRVPLDSASQGFIDSVRGDQEDQRALIQRMESLLAKHKGHDAAQKQRIAKLEAELQKRGSAAHRPVIAPLAVPDDETLPVPVRLPAPPPSPLPASVETGESAAPRRFEVGNDAESIFQAFQEHIGIEQEKQLLGQLGSHGRPFTLRGQRLCGTNTVFTWADPDHPGDQNYDIHYIRDQQGKITIRCGQAACDAYVGLPSNETGGLRGAVAKITGGQVLVHSPNPEACVVAVAVAKQPDTAVSEAGFASRGHSRVLHQVPPGRQG